MKNYMELSHQIMTDIYNLSTYDKDYNFAMLTTNRQYLAELLKFVDESRNTLIIKKNNCSFEFLLVEGNTSYIGNNILFNISLDQNMIKSKSVMIKLSDLLDQLEHRIGSNDLLSLEKNRGFKLKEGINDDVYDGADFDEENFEDLRKSGDEIDYE